ncbi:MAG: hypothetical protein HC875_30525 [Anaerolineales bacterium]|nr:hypothetical protein [Anaerolineales bacterium]
MKDSYLIATQLYQESVAAGLPADVCHCCGASVKAGVKGCFELFAEVCALGYSDPRYSAATFYGVDAHALQHPEIHGKKNNAAHLLRLCWIFETGQFEHSGVSPHWWQTYLQRGDIPLLTPPAERGHLTVVDVSAALTPAEHAQLMQQWALSVYQAWHSHHDWAKRELKKIFSG